MNLGKSVALLNLVEYLFAMYGDGARCTYAKANLFATHFQNCYLYVIADHDTLIGLSR